MKICYQYYNDSQIYSEKITDDLDENYVRSLSSKFINTKNTWIERDDGATAFIIRDGFFQLVVHNNINEFLLWITGELDDFSSV